LRLIALLLALLAGLAACDRQKPDSSQGGAPGWSGSKAERLPTGRLDRSHAGSPAPALIFEDPAGEAATLADFKGKPLLVNLWATWCAPCVAEMPTLDALAEREGGRLQVLAISQDLSGHAKVEAFFEQRGFSNLEPYIDPELGMMTQLKLDTLPTTILYDAGGKEVWRMTGMENWLGQRAARLLKEAGSVNPAAAR
jgi:thiol-disulfide isomerase/thioredoxin